VSETKAAFAHVADRYLRHVLTKEPRHVTRADLQSAFSATATALGHDMLREDIPASALDARIAAARRARDAINRHQRSKAHAALQKFWRI
jgi:hypothetical protein